MRIAYFDTNIYDALSKDDDLKAAVLDAKDGGGLRVVTSIFNCEEPLLLADKNARAFWRIMDCWREITRDTGLILSSPALLDVEIEALLTRAQMSVEDKQFTSITVDTCYDRLLESFNNNELTDAEVLRVINATRAIKDSFQDSMTDSRQKALLLKAEHRDWRPSLEEYCGSTELSMARSLIERTGYQWRLEDKEVSELLEARSLKLAVRVNLFLIHRQVVVEAKPRSGDARDVHHAIASSVAEVFVTNDAALRNGLKGLNIRDYSVESLTEFLGL